MIQYFLEIGCKSSKVPQCYVLAVASILKQVLVQPKTFIKSILLNKSLTNRNAVLAYPTMRGMTDALENHGKPRPRRKGEHHSLSSACKCKILQKKAWAPSPNCRDLHSITKFTNHVQANWYSAVGVDLNDMENQQRMLNAWTTC